MNSHKPDNLEDITSEDSTATDRCFRYLASSTIYPSPFISPTSSFNFLILICSALKFPSNEILGRNNHLIFIQSYKLTLGSSIRTGQVHSSMFQED